MPILDLIRLLNFQFKLFLQNVNKNTKSQFKFKK